MSIMDIIERLTELLENEARSCSMEPGCVTSVYVYRMWGGIVSLTDIENCLSKAKER